jgi:hypothetical protein
MVRSDLDRVLQLIAGLWVLFSVPDPGLPHKTSAFRNEKKLLYRIDFRIIEPWPRKTITSNLPVIETGDSSIVLDHSKGVKLLALGDIFEVSHGCC